MFVITTDGQIEAVDLGPARPIENAVRQYRNALITHDKEDSELSASLFRVLIQPLLSSVGSSADGRLTLNVVADGILHLLPFDALSKDGSRFLFENDDIRIQMIDRVAAKLPALEQAKQCDSGALVVANVNFDFPFHPYSEDGSRDSAEIIRRRNSERLPLRRGQRLRPLWDTAEQEVAAIANAFPANEVLSYDAALEGDLKNRRFPRIVHFATHGFAANVTKFLESAGLISALEYSGGADRASLAALFSMHFSALALTGANIRSGQEDGMMTAAEIQHIDMQCTDVVVLSACDTGVGNPAVGEGIFGLRRAFNQAGAKATVTSLWKVSSKSTSLLMEHFYSALGEGFSVAAALRQAKLSMLSNPETADPYHWAAFVHYQARLAGPQ